MPAWLDGATLVTYLAEGFVGRFSFHLEGSRNAARCRSKVLPTSRPVPRSLRRPERLWSLFELFRRRFPRNRSRLSRRVLLTLLFLAVNECHLRREVLVAAVRASPSSFQNIT